MRRYRAHVLAIAGITSLALLAGCGVSDMPDPVDEGDATVASGGNESSQTATPPDADSAFNPTDLVTRYFWAAVGAEHDSTAKDALNRAKSFLDERGQKDWQPSPELTVVRILSTTPSGGSKLRIDVNYKVIGTMNSDGTITPRSQSREPLRFQIVSHGAGWRLEAAPPELMISDTAVEKYYRAEPIYFWDLKKKTLVPDLRYLPLTMPIVLRPNQIVEWLLGGPSSLLKSAVFFRSGVTTKPIVSGSGPLTVNLSSTAAGDNVDDQQKLVYQLRWSLQPYWPGPVDLLIEGQKKNVDGSSDIYKGFNAAAAPRPAELFSVDKGKVAGFGVSDSVQLQAMLAAKANANVEFAAIAFDHRLAAFVQQRAGASDTLTLVTANDGEKAPTEALIKTLPHGAMGRPVWLQGQDQLLVPVSGRLYLVSVRGSKAEDITPSGFTDIRSVSVSPDARRIAFIAKSRAYVAALAVTGPTVRMGNEVDAIVTDRLQANAIAWTSESRLLVAGGDQGKGKLLRVTADGVLVTDESPQSEQTLTDVVAFRDSGGVIAQAESGAFRVFQGGRTQYEPALVRPFYAS
jgi:hypothetical protein